MNDGIKDVVLSAFEASLEAQLRAIRRLRQGQSEEAQPRPKKDRSQVDMAYDILKRVRTPLHVSEIIDRIQAQFGVAVDRECLVSDRLREPCARSLLGRTVVDPCPSPQPCGTRSDGPSMRMVWQ